MRGIVPQKNSLSLTTCFTDSSHNTHWCDISPRAASCHSNNSSLDNQVLVECSVSNRHSQIMRHKISGTPIIAAQPRAVLESISTPKIKSAIPKNIRTNNAPKNGGAKRMESIFLNILRRYHRAILLANLPFGPIRPIPTKLKIDSPATLVIKIDKDVYMSRQNEQLTIQQQLGRRGQAA